MGGVRGDGTTGRAVAVPEIEVRHLRRLVEIADAGSLAAAARNLGVGPARLADQLRRLEQITGGSLFLDTPAGVSPTGHGREVVETAREVLAELADLVAEARAGTDPPLRIAGVDTLLGPVVSGLAASRPGLDLTCEATSPAAAVDAVAADGADIALTVRWPHVPWPRHDTLVERRVGTHPLRLLLPATHRLAGRAVVDLTELRDATWAVRADACGAAVPAECRRFGFEPDVRYRLSGDGALHEVVAAGHAVGLTAHPAPADPAIVSLMHRDAAVAHWVVVWRAAAQPAALTDLIATVEQWQARRGWPKEARRRSDRPIRLGAERGSGVAAVVPRLRTVHGLEVAFEEVTSAQLPGALALRRLDIAVCHDLPFLPDRIPASWRRTVLRRGQWLQVVLGAEHPLAGSPLSADQLAGLRWAVPDGPSERTLLTELGRALDFEPRIDTTRRSTAEIARAIGAGELARLATPGLLPRNAVHVAIDHPLAQGSLLLLWPDDAAPGLADVAELLAGELRRIRPAVRLAADHIVRTAG